MSEYPRSIAGSSNGVQRATRYGARRQTGRIPMSDIQMPSGDVVAITDPPYRDCTCTRRANTIFIPLKPDGIMSGREYSIVAEQMNTTIAQHRQDLGGVFSTYNILAIHKLINCCLWKRYTNFGIELIKDVDDVGEKMLFHGSSKHEDIVMKGFDERHAAAGGFFGAGLYFAAHSSKSNQYVLGAGKRGCMDHNGDKSCYICERKLLLCRVLTGNKYKISLSKKLSHPPPGYHSVQGVPMRGHLSYPEWVVYRGEQAYAEYEITYKIVQGDLSSTHHVCHGDSEDNGEHS